MKRTLKNITAAFAFAVASVGCAVAQSPSSGNLDLLRTDRVALPMSVDRDSSLHLTLSTQSDLQGAGERMSISAASVNDLRAFGRAPFTLDAQVGYDPSFPDATLATSNPLNTNELWKALVGYQWGAVNFKAGVNQFNTSLNQPFDPSRAGNGLNVLEGAEFDGIYTFSPTLRLRAGGEFYDGRANAGQQSLLGAGDHMNRANLGVSYGISHQSHLELGYEWVQWDLNNSQGSLNGGGRPSEQYITIGVGQNLSKHAAFKLLYQVADYRDNGTGFASANLPNNEGSSLVGQATLKF
ncbi:MAG: hypothetical protein P4L33_05230 [Capsulimonadaceae bacterium]|nr:hypothetical protein [Capsulimonadaceae bacterium]